MAGAFYYLYKFGLLPVFYFLFFFSPFIIFGIAIRLMKDRIDDILLTRFGRIPYLAFAAIGTPIHELSHLITSLIFRHKIRKFSLFSPNDNGRLGYVEHAYDTHSIWQRVGCFFIGIAPIIAGTTLLLLLIKIFMPEFHYPALNSIPATLKIPTPGGLYDFFAYLGGDLLTLLHAFFVQAESMQWWQIVLFFGLSLAIGGHMFPSGDDFKGMVPGLLIVYLCICATYAFIIWQKVKLALILDFYLPVAMYTASLMLSITVIMAISLTVIGILGFFTKIIFRD
ncbi:MAG: hypothetical protein JNL74_21500 [Fibrobacteres bacterium]|nr:hypothetical protein [Fibrobacterota bacterium]